MTDILVWLLFGGVMLLALPLQLLGLPGTWLIAADALILRLFKGPDSIAYHTVIILFSMALFAEILELMAAVRGARSGPPVKGAAIAAIFGAFAGGILGAPVMFGLGAIPGMIIGAWMAVFGVALGGGDTLGTAYRAAWGAMMGRIKGTLLKMIVAASMVAVILSTLVF